MLRFRLETEIQKPLDQVIKLFSDRNLLTKWQPGLISSEQVENFPHKKYILRFNFGRRKMEMTETILRNELPAHFEGTYVMKGVVNRIHNSFEAKSPGITEWTCITEFRFSGLMKVISLFMKDGFKQQSEVIMKNFKSFAEHA